MQSKMQAKINALDLEYKNKISNYENQLKIKDEELETVKAESISLKSNLEKLEVELSEKISALEKNEVALASLNQGVLASPLEKSNWRDLKGDEFFAYIKAHPELTK